MKQLLDCITEANNPNYTLNEKDEKILFVILEYFIRDFERREDLIKFARKMKGYGILVGLKLEFFTIPASVFITYSSYNIT